MKPNYFVLERAANSTKLPQIHATLSLVHPYGAPEALPLQQQVERRVDVLEANLVGYELIQLQLLQNKTHGKIL